MSQRAYRDPETGQFTDDRMRNAYYWAAQVAGWMIHGPNAGIDGTYSVGIIAGRPIVHFDETWSRHNAGVIKDSLREYGFPRSMRIHELKLDDGIRLFMDPTDDRLQVPYDENWRDFDPSLNE